MMKQIYIPQPETLTNNEKDDALGGYLMMFASIIVGLPLPIINIIAALIYFLVMKSKSPFVRFHALQSMLSQIIVSIYNSVFIIITFYKLYVHIVWNLRHGGNTYIQKVSAFYPIFFTTTYMMLLIIFGIINITYLIVSIIAAIKASQGKIFLIPIIGKISASLTLQELSFYNTEESRNQQSSKDQSTSDRDSTHSPL